MNRYPLLTLYDLQLNGIACSLDDRPDSEAQMIQER